MNVTTRCGLTLGKFAPLHKGHQFLIETALGEVDRLIVLIYDAPETTVPLSIRADWLRNLYPDIEVIEVWDGPNVVGASPEITRMHDEHIVSLVGDRNITHFYSSEFYGDHVSRALGAVDRRVDEARRVVPISGTELRSDPYGGRGYLAPAVYRDLIARIVFLGAPSTGKSTLATRAAELFETVHVPEYGRDYWDAHQIERRLSADQLVEIAIGHRIIEEKVMLEANRFLFVDTDATTTANFARHYHGSVDPRLMLLAEATRDRYDLFILCGDDIPYDVTWDRSGEVDRRIMQRRTRSDLIARRIPFVELRGSLDERLGILKGLLHDFDRFRPLGDHLVRVGSEEKGVSIPSKS